MLHVEITRFIPGPRPDVWKTYTDHEKFWSFMGSPRIERVGPDDPNGTGCIRVLGRGPLAAREEILHFDPPNRLTYRVLEGSPPITNHLGEVIFEREGDGTRMIWRASFGCTIPGLGLGLRFVVRRVFERAARHLEQQFAGPANT